MAKKIPVRQCVGCGEMKSKKEMMRVLKTAEDEICLDVTGKKNGRGAYLCKQRKFMMPWNRNFIHRPGRSKSHGQSIVNAWTCGQRP